MFRRLVYRVLYDIYWRSCLKDLLFVKVLRLNPRIRCSAHPFLSRESFDNFLYGRDEKRVFTILLCGPIFALFWDVFVNRHTGLLFVAIAFILILLGIWVMNRHLIHVWFWPEEHFDELIPFFRLFYKEKKIKKLLWAIAFLGLRLTVLFLSIYITFKVLTFSSSISK